MDKSIVYQNAEQKLLHAAEELMNVLPMNKISVTRICDHAGLNRSTFYDHFKSVDELLYYIDSPIIREFKEFLLKENCINPSFVSKLLKLVEKNKEFITNYYSLENAIPFYDYFIQYPECDCPSGDYVARFWSAAFNAVIRRWLFEDTLDILQVEQIITLYLDNYIKR